HPTLALTNTRMPFPATLLPGFSVFGLAVIRLPLTVLVGLGLAAVAPLIPTTAVAATAVAAPNAVSVLPRISCPPHGRSSAHGARRRAPIQPPTLAQIAGPLYKTVHATSDLERRDQLRAGQRPREDVFGDLAQVGALPPAVLEDGHEDQ